MVELPYPSGRSCIECGTSGDLDTDECCASCSPTWGVASAFWSRALGRDTRGADPSVYYAPSAERVAVLAAMPYGEYLLTLEWAERRRVALCRALRRCERCGRRGWLEVHHRTYERRGAELPDDLEVLCVGCHRQEHEVAA
jgi:hypothetical protein